MSLSPDSDCGNVPLPETSKNSLGSLYPGVFTVNLDDITVANVQRVTKLLEMVICLLADLLRGGEINLSIFECLGNVFNSVL